MMTISQQVGDAVRSQRKRLGMSFERVAELAGVARNTVRNIENNVAPDCSLANCERVCAAIGLELLVGIRGARRLHSTGAVTKTSLLGGES